MWMHCTGILTPSGRQKRNLQCYSAMRGRDEGKEFAPEETFELPPVCLGALLVQTKSNVIPKSSLLFSNYQAHYQNILSS